MFDHKTIDAMDFYVYALFEQGVQFPFYIGKGTGNRVFSHVACSLKDSNESDKYEKIRAINATGGKVGHIFIRHGISSSEALLVEASIIDLLTYMGSALTKQVAGHYSHIGGLMTEDEITRNYSAFPLEKLEHPAVIININKTYLRGSGNDGIYQATRGSWVISKSKREEIQYALSEYRGLIVEVFRIDSWYPVDSKDKNGASKTRWAFNGKVADGIIRDKYINKSISHVKVQGAANPIRYNL